MLLNTQKGNQMPNIYSTKIIELDNHDKDFAGFKWVMKAVDFNDTTPMARVLKIECESIIATDGHRLHIYRPEEGYPAGIFKILLRQRNQLIFAQTTDVKFPDYRKIIPDYSDWKEIQIWDQVERTYATLIRNMKENNGLNFEYVRDVVPVDKMFIGEDPTGPVLFEGFRKMALVMPMHI